MLFIKEKPVRAITLLREKPKYLSQLAKEADVTYPYIAQLARILVAKGLAVIETKGKFRILRLTEEGKRLAALLEEVRKVEKG